MEKFKTSWVHIVGWSLIYIYILAAYFFSLSSGSNTLLGLSLNLTQMAQFYFCYTLVYPYYQRSKRWLVLLAGLTSAMLLFILCRYTLEEVLYLHFFDLSNYAPSTTFVDYAVDNLYYGAAFICISALVYSVEQIYKLQLLKVTLEEEKKKSELAFLRSQINPHFLFNILNFIYAQAMPISDKMGDAVLKLSELMRYALTDNPENLVPLRKELSYLEDFISLQRMRFEGDIQLKFNIEVDSEHYGIAPFLLIPFVENAFKHGIITDAAYPIRIEVVAKAQTIHLFVSNKTTMGCKDSSHGIGLVNVKRRLELMYPNEHQLEISERSDFFEIQLSLKNKNAN